ncbi:MAG: hypothetical protein V1768_02975 [Patescibacteria group bacterium]
MSILNCKQFIFQKYQLKKSKNQIRFYYCLDNKIKFTEIITLNQKPNWKKIDAKLLDKILFNLHLMLGISYWKTCCPKKIIIKSGVLSKKQAQFWNKLYANGLGEFYYKNKIDFRGLVNFPYKQDIRCPKTAQPQFAAANWGWAVFGHRMSNSTLVPLGGGRDSIVTAELLKEKNINFNLFSLRESAVQKNVAKIINKKYFIVNRIIDKKLLNKSNKYYQGHIPITAVYSFTALLIAVLHNYKNIIFSNEKSANFGNVKYLGKIINHQYSKSAEFEKDFQNYIHQFITPGIDYFSLLRSLSELQITELFSKHKKYFYKFSSCNLNFKMSGEKKTMWCCKCPKCAFVFCQLSAFISKKELLKIFGKNLYADKSLLNLYLELLGKKNIKPFDCVGTPEEVKTAMHLALQKNEFREDFILKYFKKNVLSKLKK